MSILCWSLKEHVRLRLFSNSSSHSLGLVFLLTMVSSETSIGPLNSRPIQEYYIVSPILFTRRIKKTLQPTKHTSIENYIYRLKFIVCDT